MASIVLTNAKIFYGGYDFSGDQNELSLEYSSEMQDTTAFGDDTRQNTGGLEMATLNGTGFWNGGTGNVDNIMFSLVAENVQPVTVFGDGITEGQESGGYSMKAVIETYNVTGTVGSMLNFNLTAQGRGVK